MIGIIQQGKALRFVQNPNKGCMAIPRAIHPYNQWMYSCIGCIVSGVVSIHWDTHEPFL